MAVNELGASWLGFESCREVQRDNDFELLISGLSRMTDHNDATRLLRLAVERAQLPSEDTTVQNVWYANAEAKIAGTTTYGQNSVVCRDIISRSGEIDIEQIINDWRRKVYDPETDKVGFACDYRTDARLVQYAPDGTLERTWYLENIWPSSVSYGDMQYGSGGAIKKMNITFQYDKAYKNYDRSQASASKSANYNLPSQAPNY